jgi:hypothetical protein
MLQRFNQFDPYCRAAKKAAGREFVSRPAT